MRNWFKQKQLYILNKKQSSADTFQKPFHLKAEMIIYWSSHKSSAVPGGRRDQIFTGFEDF